MPILSAGIATGELDEVRGLTEAAVMCVVLHVWHNEGEIRKQATRQIGGKLTERNKALQLVLGVHHIREVSKGVVML